VGPAAASLAAPFPHPSVHSLTLPRPPSKPLARPTRPRPTGPTPRVMRCTVQVLPLAAACGAGGGTSGCLPLTDACPAGGLLSTPPDGDPPRAGQRVSSPLNPFHAQRYGRALGLLWRPSLLACASPFRGLPCMAQLCCAWLAAAPGTDPPRLYKSSRLLSSQADTSRPL